MTERITPPINPNFARGISGVEIPELGQKQQGKVRDIWQTSDGRRVMVTTDRLSAYDRIICSIPGKGQVLNTLTEYWMKQVSDIVPNHILSVPHPNVVIARQAEATLPVEVVVRRYMARSATSTSVYDGYIRQHNRIIYGIPFPEGLVANQEFPQGSIITPTTKAEFGQHDVVLTDEEAANLVNSQLGKRFGRDVWSQVKEVALAVFEHGRQASLESGLMLVDTKYEFGIDENGKLMLIDEVHTPDSSRYWRGDSYQERFEMGEDPQAFDKEIIRKWLASQGFKGEGLVPTVPTQVIDQVAEAYQIPYHMLTGKKLGVPEKDPFKIRNSVLAAL